MSKSFKSTELSFGLLQNRTWYALRRLAVLLLAVVLVPSAPAECFPQERLKLVASDAAASDQFGCSMAVSGDTAVIGAFGDDGYAGSAYVFVRAGGVWTEQAKLVASDPETKEFFGASVAIAGDTAVIGAFGDGGYVGAAYVFVRAGGVWTRQATLTASDGAKQHGFGYRVAVSGDTAVIGASWNDDAGAAYVFVRAGGVWTEQAKLTATYPTTADQFGSSVAIAGDTAVIGAYGDGGYVGSAYVFARADGVWTLQAMLAASDPAADDAFGASVAVSGDTAVIGARWKDCGTGAAYVFVRAGGVWGEPAKLTAFDAADYDEFGTSVAIAGDTAVIGACGDNGRVGSAYVFVRAGDPDAPEWTQQAKLTASDAADYDEFGASVAIAGDTAVIGATSDSHAGGTRAGSEYVFALNCESACCFADSSCQMETETECTADAGIYQGDGVSCEAVHCPCEYVLTVGVQGEGAAAAVPALDAYDCAAVVELTATPAECWRFVGWEGGLSGDSNPASITMDGNKTVTAVFAIEQYALQVAIEGQGSVARDPAGDTFDCGSTVQLTATAASGWHFAGWSGDATGANVNTSILMDGNRQVSAVFEAGDDQSEQDQPGGGICPSAGAGLIGLTLAGLVRRRK